MKRKPRHLSVIKTYLVKCRLELYMGDPNESPEIITYHNLIISAPSEAQAKREAEMRVSERIPERVEGKIVVEHCTKGV